MSPAEFNDAPKNENLQQQGLDQFGLLMVKIQGMIKEMKDKCEAICVSFAEKDSKIGVEFIPRLIDDSPKSYPWDSLNFLINRREFDILAKSSTEDTWRPAEDGEWLRSTVSLKTKILELTREVKSAISAVENLYGSVTAQEISEVKQDLTAREQQLSGMVQEEIGEVELQLRRLLIGRELEVSYTFGFQKKVKSVKIIEVQNKNCTT